MGIDNLKQRGVSTQWSKFFHILWTLLFLKLYMSESVLSGLVGVDEKSYRKWIWIFTPKIAQLKSKIVSNTSFLK